MGGDVVRDGLDTVLGGVYPFRYLPAEFYSEVCRGKGIGRNGRTFPLVGRVGTHTHVDNDTSEGEVDSADYETRDMLESAITRAASSSPDRPNRRRAHAARVHFIPRVLSPS